MIGPTSKWRSQDLSSSNRDLEQQTSIIVMASPHQNSEPHDKNELEPQRGTLHSHGPALIDEEFFQRLSYRLYRN